MTTLPCPALISLGISARAQKNFVEDYLDHISDSRQRAVAEKANAITDSLRALNSPLWEGSTPSESIICP